MLFVTCERQFASPCARLPDQPNKGQIVPTASAILDDGTIVEMVYRADLRRTLFAIYSGGRSTLQDAIDIGFDARLVPFSPNNTRPRAQYLNVRFQSR